MSKNGSRSPITIASTQATPSLALIKYWGKSDSNTNLPATPSIAITLEKLTSLTRVFALDMQQIGASLPLEDVVILNNIEQESQRFADFFEGLRTSFGKNYAFWAESTNNFPTAAGLASSSSGFAALTFAAAIATGNGKADLSALSALARRGSGSAARSLYGGFTLLPANSESAEVLYHHNYWPDLRLIIVRIADGPKDISSRKAMEQTRQTSPFYESWVLDAPSVCADAQEALKNQDLERLGQCMRTSYLRMFATMFAATPPIIYWKPESLAVIKLCDTLRKQGIAAWETMDAGPQVKILTTSKDVQNIVQALEQELGITQVLIDNPGPGPKLISDPQLLHTINPSLHEKAKSLGLDLSTAEYKGENA